jgi:hypothetical protein
MRSAAPRRRALPPMVGVVVVVAIAAAAAGGCTVGGGSGRVRGEIFVEACGEEGENYAGPVDGAAPMDGGLPPRAFDLEPSFFAGEPIEDIARGGVRTNRLIIRIQSNGNRIEVTDTLYFDVRSAYEVARCLRGRTVNGVPDWDMNGNWCEWAPGATRPRIYMDHKLPVNGTLSLMFTCSRARIVGFAIDRPMVRGSWIDFLEFGSALVPETIPPEQRAKIPGDFKVEFGQRLSANFRVDLEDQRRVEAARQMLLIPPPRIGGTLGGTPETGSFGFTLERGRAAQPFP